MLRRYEMSAASCLAPRGESAGMVDTASRRRRVVLAAIASIHAMTCRRSGSSSESCARLSSGSAPSARRSFGRSESAGPEAKGSSCRYMPRRCSPTLVMYA